MYIIRTHPINVSRRSAERAEERRRRAAAPAYENESVVHVCKVGVGLAESSLRGVLMFISKFSDVPRMPASFRAKWWVVVVVFVSFVLATVVCCLPQEPAKTLDQGETRATPFNVTRVLHFAEVSFCTPT